MGQSRTKARFLVHWLIGDDVPKQWFDPDQESRVLVLKHFNKEYGDSQSRDLFDATPAGLETHFKRHTIGPMVIPKELVDEQQEATK
jgi:hypothetical protein